jgi:hypothetical protein
MSGKSRVVDTSACACTSISVTAATTATGPGATLSSYISDERKTRREMVRKMNKRKMKNEVKKGMREERQSRGE